ncbi:hypothetical protein EXU57_17120 [Segetibacter sp. 3557_3]|uniref:hypothetical protein n=1 Tax=Segetibacter sp. 3557_3 TaxID=2547429 RepID=UPI0010585DA8|nr:hypothetical protein [Segetibacter sp. 3557_3]TDH23522.1 hypothetical protein EXU57_17120 [Segetibacter sp. 3557_3]
MEEITDTQLKNFQKTRSTVTILAISTYVVFSIVKRTSDNHDLYWIPLIIVLVNLVILVRTAIKMFKHSLLRSKSTLIWLSCQSIINLVLVLLICSYFGEG